MSPGPQRPQPGKLMYMGLAATLLLPSVLSVGYIVLTQSMQTALIDTVDGTALPEVAKRGFAPETIKSNAQIMMLLTSGDAGLISDEDVAYYQPPPGPALNADAAKQGFGRHPRARGGGQIRKRTRQTDDHPRQVGRSGSTFFR